VLVRLIVLGLLASSALAEPLPAPVLAVDPDQPGPDLPPVGRSLFDFLTMREEDGRLVQVVPFPFSDLLDQIEARIGAPEPSLEKVLIPLGRSLQRNAANPDFFEFPRAVVAVDQESVPRPGEAGMLLADRVYLGYQEKAATIEVISYNEAAARFEYQVVRDYRDGGTADVYYADRPTCIACHRNHAPIFSKPLWDETNANAHIAATLMGLKDSFYGIPVGRGVDIPNAIDDATDRANLYAALQRVWQDACADACRADGLLAALQYKLAGNRHPPPDEDGPGRAFVAALVPQWEALWPGGLAVPQGDVPNRAPLAAPLDPAVPLSEAEAIRLSTIERQYEPFEPRPPAEIWRPDDPALGRKLIEGLAQFVARSDIQRLDEILWQSDAATTEAAGDCAVTTVDLGGERLEIRIDCGPEGLILHGYVQLQGLEVEGGTISRLQIEGQLLTNLKIAGGFYAVPRTGPPLLSLQLQERSAGLHARLPDGNAIRHLTLEWSPGADEPHGTATATVAADFEVVEKAVAAIASGASGALAAPLRRAAVMRELFAQLGDEPLAWCCLDDTGMPAAALEP
jgi:hypothetical protein